MSGRTRFTIVPSRSRSNAVRYLPEVSGASGRSRSGRSAYNRYQSSMAGLGYTGAEIAAMYHAGCRPGDDLEFFKTRGGKLEADCYPSSSSRRRRRKRSDDSDSDADSDIFSDIEDDEGPSTTTDPTFAYAEVHHVGAAKPDTKPAPTVLNPNAKDYKKISDNGKSKEYKCYETEDHKAIQPNLRLVFMALFKLKGWMQYPPVREEKYDAWCAEFRRYRKHNDKLILQDLQKIIQRENLNPSERTGVASGGKYQTCDGYDDEHCVAVIDEITSRYKDECGPLDFDTYWETKYTNDHLWKMTKTKKDTLKAQERLKFDKMEAISGKRAEWARKHGLHIKKGMPATPTTTAAVNAERVAEAERAAREAEEQLADAVQANVVAGRTPQSKASLNAASQRYTDAQTRVNRYRA